MKQSREIKSEEVRWSHLLPDEFRKRQSDCPVAVLPIGLCEPHGHVAALGLDLIKAEYYCNEAARMYGGIVAPSQGYHIHETGFHAPWLEEVVGETNPMMAGMPPLAICHHFIYQLRAFANAGFQYIIVVSGHSGGSQNDLRLIASAFENRFQIPIVVKTDPEWVEGLYEGDHAGKYEISQLMAIDQNLINLDRINRMNEPNSGGRLALGEDAAESSIAHGQEINQAIIEAIGEKISSYQELKTTSISDPKISLPDTEELWQNILSDEGNWFSHGKKPGQNEIAENSRWKPFENLSKKLDL